MRLSAIARLIGVAAFLCHLGMAGQTGSIIGQVVDPAGGILQFPIVRLHRQSDSRPPRQSYGEETGRFRLGKLQPGVYTIGIAVAGFRKKEVTGVAVTAGQLVDLGVLRLDAPRCSDPGVYCHEVKGNEDPIHAQGTIEVPVLCGVDIDEGQVLCTIELDGRGSVPPMRDSVTDFWMREGSSGQSYLKPRNGAALALTRSAERNKESCMTALYSKNEVRIDGLAAGSRICVRTNGDRYAEVILDVAVPPKAGSIKAKFITWWGTPDYPTLHIAH